MRKGSIRERYATLKNLTVDQLLDPGTRDFIPVYDLKNESLVEIENDTVKAALHLSRVPLNNSMYTVHMTVYVIPKGLFGIIYMAIIKPFRLWIVYPAIMQFMQKQWQAYKANQN